MHLHVHVLVLVLYMHVHSNNNYKQVLRKLIKTLNRPKVLSQYMSLVVCVFFWTLSLAMIRVNKVSSSLSLSHFPPYLPLMMVHIYFNLNQIESLIRPHIHTHIYIHKQMSWADDMLHDMHCTYHASDEMRHQHVRWNEASHRHRTSYMSHFYTPTEPIERPSKIYGGPVDLKGPELDALIRDKISSWAIVAWRAAAHLVCGHCTARWRTYYWWWHKEYSHIPIVSTRWHTFLTIINENICMIPTRNTRPRSTHTYTLIYTSANPLTHTLLIIIYENIPIIPTCNQSLWSAHSSNANTSHTRCVGAKAVT